VRDVEDKVNDGIGYYCGCSLSIWNLGSRALPRFHSAELTKPGNLSRGTMNSSSTRSGSNVNPA